MSENNDRVQLLSRQLQQAVNIVQATLKDTPTETAHAHPGGKANTIAANAAHIVTGIDGLVNALVAGGQPVMASEPTGLSSPPPMGGDWGDWGQTVEVDFAALHSYGEKVMASAQSYLDSISDDDLSRMVKAPSGNEMDVEGWLTITILNTAWHTGEIAALKGAQGLKGYPF